MDPLAAALGRYTLAGGKVPGDEATTRRCRCSIPGADGPRPRELEAISQPPAQNARMHFRPSVPAPAAFEWPDSVPGPNTHARIVRAPVAAAAPSVQRINIVFETHPPRPIVTELDANTGWAEFQAAMRRHDGSR